MYYEDQKDESLRKSKHYIAERLPKFLDYFQRVLKSKASGDGPWLYAGKLTYADLVLFQVMSNPSTNSQPSRKNFLILLSLSLYQ